MPKPKVDLAKAFGVEDIITPRSPSHDTEEQIRDKSPALLGDEVKVLMDEIIVHVNNSDISSIILSLEAARMRIAVMNEIAQSLQKRLGKG